MTARCQAPAMTVQCFYLFFKFSTNILLYSGALVDFYFKQKNSISFKETVMLNIVSAQHLMQPADSTQFCWKKFYITVLALSGLGGPVGGPSQ